ncbi:DHS-like NAD/FAD-binding domain-containing protein [Hysterangium stoloniferum]|nr:DHS-like NAD/FAD-binding domain-containing protein [Hysterangium stoloniferum]
MRVSVPNIPVGLLNTTNPSPVSLDHAVEKVVTFLSPGNVATLTGAGVSVDSGIRAYRGKDGRYMNPNYKPIFFHELIEDSPRGHSFRQRYWSRSYMGYPPVLRAQPNPTHYALAALLKASFIKRIVTQNVDGLHLKASARRLEDEDPRILQLHGSLHRVQCRRAHGASRASFQARLSAANPRWKDLADAFERHGTRLRTNPDGDVEMPGMSFEHFVVPACERCAQEGLSEHVMKPSVIFFGESIPGGIRDRSFGCVDACERLLVVGTTLATFSAFRLVKHALEENKPVLLLNLGPTRADGLLGVEKIEAHCGEVLRSAAKTLTADSLDDDIHRMLSSGVVTPPPEEDDRVPAAG